MDGRYYGGTNKVQSDEEDAPVAEVYEPLGISSRARKTTPDNYGCEERSDDGAIQQDILHAKPLKQERVKLIYARQTTEGE